MGEVSRGARAPSTVPLRSAEAAVAINTARFGGLASAPRRIVIACDACNRRKVKCDGLHPCSRCIKSKAQCVFAESRVRHVAERFQPSATKRSTSKDERSEVISAAAEQRNGHLEDELDRAQRESVVPSESGRGLPDVGNGQRPYLGTRANAWDLFNPRMSQVEDVPLAALPPNHVAPVPYRSIWPPQSLFANTSPSTHQTPGPATLVDGPISHMHTNSSRTKADDAWRDPDAMGRAIDELPELFFRHMAAILPINMFHFASVRLRLQQRSLPEYLLLAIRTVAAPFSDNPLIVADQSTRYAAADPFYNAARQAACHATLVEEEKSVELVQALLLLGWFSNNYGKRKVPPTSSDVTLGSLAS
ncbi:hypothetical protein HKX48_001730 [Thoreauomyces humboldtii]|nr:hypothetical protein HKX48_001730 [Thoreauomyces humboldtii]